MQSPLFPPRTVTLAGFIIVYSLLGLLDIILLVKNARKGPAEEA